MPLPSECIEHVVVLMLENRSFDHMLGFLPREGHLRDMEGLTGNEYNLANPRDPHSQKFTVSRKACYELLTGARGVGPPHDFLDVNRQLTNLGTGPSETLHATNNGFVRAWTRSLQNYLDEVKATGAPTIAQMARVLESFAPQHLPILTNLEHAFLETLKATGEPTIAEMGRVMECFDPEEQLPVLSTLAKEFVLCDHWFCSVPGPTMPNRLFIHAGTSGGYAHNAFGDKFPCRTIYHNLSEAGLSWSVYHQNFDIVMNFTELHYTDANNPNKLNFRDYALFKEDIAGGKLAHYSFVNPRFISHWGNDVSQDVELANSQHAPCDVRPGEALIADVYNSLRAVESVWEKTLLVVLYDEHGGFYDHVPPPTGVPNPDGLRSKDPLFDFTRLGFRVPALLISPWLPRMVDSTVYEHSSVLATVKKLFNLPDFLTQRDRTANSFEHLFGKTELRRNTPRTLTALKVPKDAPEKHMARLLDPVQKEVMEGVISHLPPGEEPGLAARQLETGTLTVGQASALTHRAIKHFKERVVANGGKHPHALNRRA